MSVETDAATSLRVVLNADFYRANYQRLVMALLLMMLLIAALVGAVVYIVVNPPQPKFFAVDNQGRVIPATPLSQPNLSNPALLAWSSEAASTIYNFDFLNFADQLNVSAKYFTDEGWSSFKDAIQAPDGVLSRVTAQKLTVSGVAREAPVITDEGDIGGVHYWSIAFPLVVTYKGDGGASMTENNLVLMKVVRVPATQSIYGVQIAQLSVNPTAVS